MAIAQSPNMHCTNTEEISRTEINFENNVIILQKIPISTLDHLEMTKLTR